MKLFKIIIFLVTGAILYPLMLLTYFSYCSSHDSRDFKWFQKVWHERISLRKISAILIAPVYFGIVGFLFLAVPFWESLLDD